MNDDVTWCSKKPAFALALSMLLAALLPLFAGLLFYSQANDVVTGQQRELAGQSVRLMLQKLDADVLEMTGYSMRLKSRLRTMHLPKTKELTTKDRLRNREISDLLLNIKQTAGLYLKELYVMRADGEYAITSTAVIEREKIYERYYANNKISREEFEKIHHEQYFGTLVGLKGKCPIFVMTLSQDAKREKATNQLVFVLSETYFSGVVRQFGIVHAAYDFCDAKGEVLWSAAAEGTSLDNVAFRERAAIGGYFLSAKMPADLVWKNVEMLRVLYLLLSTAALCMLALMVWYFSRKTALPINRLIEYIQTHYKPVEEEGMEGLSLISSVVEKMISEREQRIEQIQKYQEQERLKSLADAFLGLNGNNEALEFKNNFYVVACFSQQYLESENKLKHSILSCIPAGYLGNCINLGDAVCLLLEKSKGEMDEKEAEHVLESMLEQMDDISTAEGHSCGMSMVHHLGKELGTAYREAKMAADYLMKRKDLAIMRFDAMRYTPEYFLRDWHHLDKQLSFAKLMGEGEFERADMALPSLFPEDFLQGSSTTLATLHLNSLKYQFLHDIDSALCRETTDSDELSRVMIREILSCNAHEELLHLMHRILTELDDHASHLPYDSGQLHLNEVKSYIRKNSQNKQLSVASVADVFAVTPNALSKFFAKYAEMGVLQYIHKIRIEHACNLLLQHETMTISEIADKVGYTSTITFTRSFKARYRMTPGEYRKLSHD